MQMFAKSAHHSKPSSHIIKETHDSDKESKGLASSKKTLKTEENKQEEPEAASVSQPVGSLDMQQIIANLMDFKVM